MIRKLLICLGLMQSIQAQEVSNIEMQRIYDEIKTPYKYGLVVAPASDQFKTDCPTVFRHKGKWYMTYIVFDGRGYETWMAESNDLLHWNANRKILPFPNDTTAWDANQRAGYVSLYDTKWDGSNKLMKKQGHYWLTYIGGKGIGYEVGDLSIGLARSVDPVGIWTPLSSPILTAKDKHVRWWENKKLFKSTVIYDRSKVTGSPYVMFYNANGDTAIDNKKTRWYERIGMAVSDDMVHWKRYLQEPVVHHVQGITGDPFIQKIGDIWVMFYFGAFWKDKGGAFDRFACSYDLVHWTDWDGDDLIKPSEEYDKEYAHKPCVIKYKGVVYHFYNAVNKKQQRGIAVATSKDLGKTELSFIYK